ncbi:MAG TPA: hypothetical protein VF041_00450 [Gemmatimonadaceae bacterium]
MSGDPALRHALAVFGGALGLVLIVAAVALGIRDFPAIGSGCARCAIVVACAVAAVVIGVLLVRGAVRAMRADE